MTAQYARRDDTHSKSVVDTPSDVFRIDGIRYDLPPGVGQPDPAETADARRLPLSHENGESHHALRTYLPNEIGDGYWDWIEIGPNLLLSITDVNYLRPHLMVVPSGAQTIKIRVLCSGSIHIANGDVRVSDGSAIVQRINQDMEVEHRIDTTNARLRMVVIHALPQALFDLGAKSDALSELVGDFLNFSAATDPVLSIGASAKLVNIARDILESRNRFPGELRQTYVKGKAYELLGEAILRLNPMIEKRSAGHRFRHADIVRLHEAKRAIFSNLEQSPTIDQIAHLVAMSRTKLITGFRAVFNETVQEYRSRVRLEEAIRMIEDTDLPMAEIGRRVGYEHPSNFSQLIKQRFNASPRELRVRAKVEP